ncbi:efflux transporter outer membrane subunit [Methylonatrum kenyense]|uniref:efflux transporter outer membrane subunit n=1 Tax=Methylonatrum kenyense TaxID=455253 RepID=UPI0020BF4CE2|nr:efflux transporter outer membrane subunit [Methylonatrum kenyense]MCK8516510.1 efflux transporter outer membrane subunit [Methylonatrum kenyense]
MPRNWINLALVTGLLAGCAVGPDYEAPEADLPSDWPEHTLLSEAEQEEWQDWWTRYEDPALNALVARALDDNLDIRLQVQRVQESRARLGLADANRLPTLDAQAEAMRSRPSAAELGIDDDGFGLSDPRNLFSITGVLGYEVDLWGRLSRQQEAAEAFLQQSLFGHEAVRLAVIADVVIGYVNLRSAQDQLAIAERTVASRERALELEEIRYAGGEADALAVRQARAQLETTRAQIPGLREQLRLQESVLGDLVGLSPAELLADIALEQGALADLRLPESIPAELPSEILRRRPDVRAAEAELMAATADIGVAEADRLPRLNLMGFLGTAATTTSDLFSTSAETWGIGASVAGPVLDFGRGQARIATAESLRDQAETRYSNTVNQAFREVRDGLVLYDAAEERVQAIEAQVTAVREARDLARLQYDEGLIGLLDVLDAERTLLEAELGLNQAIRDRLAATATLFKALGGGWQAEQRNGPE